jgi:hypothetical protein
MHGNEEDGVQSALSPQVMRQLLTCMAAESLSVHELRTCMLASLHVPKASIYVHSQFQTIPSHTPLSLTLTCCLQVCSAAVLSAATGDDSSRATTSESSAAINCFLPHIHVHLYLRATPCAATRKCACSSRQVAVQVLFNTAAQTLQSVVAHISSTHAQLC